MQYVSLIPLVGIPEIDDLSEAHLFFNSTVKNEAKPFHYLEYIDRRVSRI